MNMPDETALNEYYQDAASWAEDRVRDQQSSVRIAWIVAGIAAAIALTEAIALMLMMPLKQIEPYAVLVDRQTGYVQALNLSKGQSITPDEALVHAMLAQYVTAREGFNIASLKDDYRKVGLWSADDARSQYVAAMQSGNPQSPLASLPRSTVITVEVRSILPLSVDSALVRFATIRTDAGGQPVQQGAWAAVIRYRFSSADMSAESRLVNPLGFQVLRYNRSAEMGSPIAPVQSQVEIPLPAKASPDGVAPGQGSPATPQGVVPATGMAKP